MRLQLVTHMIGAKLGSIVAVAALAVAAIIAARKTSIFTGKTY